MKTGLAMLALVSFAAIVVFGYLAMESMHGTQILCLKNTARAFGCLTGQNTFSVFEILAHFAIVIVAMVFVLSVMLALCSQLVQSKSRSEPTSRQILTVESPQKMRITAWFELLQKRDPSAHLAAAV